MTVSILFVCLGNICRSPLAEAALRVEAEQAGLDLVVESAGTGGWHAGQAPDPRAIAAARRQGVDISHLRARKVAPADFERFDRIVALDAENYADLAAMRPPGARASLSLLLDAVPGRAGQGVADPYYGGDADFDTTWREVSEGARHLVATLAAERIA